MIVATGIKESLRVDGSAIPTVGLGLVLLPGGEEREAPDLEVYHYMYDQPVISFERVRHDGCGNDIWRPSSKLELLRPGGAFDGRLIGKRPNSRPRSDEAAFARNLVPADKVPSDVSAWVLVTPTEVMWSPEPEPRDILSKALPTTNGIEPILTQAQRDSRIHIKKVLDKYIDHWAICVEAVLSPLAACVCTGKPADIWKTWEPPRDLWVWGDKQWLN